jgi:thiol-disulfide isomerase/thioredoxin
MNKKALLVVLAVLVGAAAVWLASAQYAQRTASQIPEAPSGEKVTLRFYKNPVAVSSFAMHDLDGRTISSADLQGKVTIINFWATWCPPCRAEIPDLVALQAKYGDRLQIVGVSQDEGPIDSVKRFAAAQQMNYPVVMTSPEIEKAFPGVTALPTSFILDRQGRIVQRHVGLLNPLMTEQETRALAGLPVNASIEEVDRAQPAKLENAAQATEIPGVDLKSLPPDRRAAALQKLNTDPCTCGCDNTVAKCRIDDPKCSTSLPLAQKIVQEIAEQRP